MRERIAWALAAIGAIMAIMGDWHQFGWTTPHAHEQDVTSFRNEWRCDELSEEINELVSLTGISPLQREILRRKQDAYDEGDCDQYETF